jgi:hypothetical protein
MNMKKNIIFSLLATITLSGSINSCSKPKIAKSVKANLQSSESSNTDLENEVQNSQMNAISKNPHIISEKHNDERAASPNYSNLAPLIGSGISLPDLVIPPVAEKIKREIEREFGGMQGSDPRITAIFRKLWLRSWPDTFNASIASSQSEEISTGKILPRELSDFRKTSKEFVVQIQKGISKTFSNKEELEAAYLMLTLSVGDAQTGSRNLLISLSDRKNNLPPTRGDIILCNIVTQALQDMKQGGVSAISFDDLKSLAGSKNPVYRLIAIQASYKAITDQTRFTSPENSMVDVETAPVKMDFYKNFLKESDPQILKEAVLAMGAIPSSDAMTTLINFREEQQKAGKLELVNVAEDAIRTCESTMRSFRVGK